MIVEQSLNENTQEWGKLTEDEKQQLRDFTILWAYFEGWVTKGQRHIDDRIEERVEQSSENAFEKIPDTESAFEYFRSRYHPNGVASPRFQELEFRTNRRDYVAWCFLEESPSPRDQVKTVLFILNRLRNNFLHGGKRDTVFEANRKISYTRTLLSWSYCRF